MEERYPKVGEIWEHPKFKVFVEIMRADDIEDDIFGKVICAPLDGGNVQEMCILDFLSNGFVFQRECY